jgi:hypothetical protein
MCLHQDKACVFRGLQSIPGPARRAGILGPDGPLGPGPSNGWGLSCGASGPGGRPRSRLPWRSSGRVGHCPSRCGHGRLRPPGPPPPGLRARSGCRGQHGARGQGVDRGQNSACRVGVLWAGRHHHDGAGRGYRDRASSAAAMSGVPPGGGGCRVDRALPRPGDSCRAALPGSASRCSGAQVLRAPAALVATAGGSRERHTRMALLEALAVLSAIVVR